MANEITHHYGDNVHILNDPVFNTMLMQASMEPTQQPILNRLVEFLYLGLLHSAIAQEGILTIQEVATRMTRVHPEQKYRGEVLDRQQRIVVVNLARAGTWPSAICYDRLNYIIEPDHVRQDHIMAARQVSDSGQVKGASITATKVGGDIQGALVLFPDPMGATGSTIIRALEYYKNEVSGTPRRLVGLHMIVTPEYISAIKKHQPDFVIYALRLDRGLSSKRALASDPGTHWSEERGLNENQYIVPGAGGLGELLNNSYV